MAQRYLPLRPPPETWGTPPSPIPPLGTKGRDCGPSPLETPPGVGRGSGSEKRSRGCPLCSPTSAFPPDAGTHLGHLRIFSATGRWVLDFVGSAYRPLLRMGELAALPVNSSPSVFSFVPCPARFLFGKKKRKCGGHSNGQSPFGDYSLAGARKMWGTFCTAKPCFLSWKPGPPLALLRRDQNNLLVK